jgi:REP element-mobilizing transposase RayT
MPHTYVSCDCHCVFGTKERAAVLKPDMRERLFRFMAGVAGKYGIGSIAAGGVADHIHLLINLPATMSIAFAMKLIKGSSARWFHKT